MCRLFAASGTSRFRLNEELSEFFSHSDVHKDGWGIAFLDSETPELIKEKLCANHSDKLRQLLSNDLRCANVMAHIRRASCGVVSEENSHPFVMKDRSDRTWTFMHNGTIFEGAVLERYVSGQRGATDSERCLCRLIDRLDAKIAELGRPPEERERFDVVNETAVELSPNNVFNFIAFDGELFYVHANSNNHETGLPIALYTRLTSEGTRLWSTCACDEEEWTPLPIATTLAYRAGTLVFTAPKHSGECYRDAAAELGLK